MYENIILIPYRNRERHLKYFIDNNVPLIEKYLPNTKVVVIEQEEGKEFNRGCVLNVGFKEYENNTKYFITQDVDINPSLEVIKNVYTKKDIEMLRIKSAHAISLGGIIKAKHDVVFNINGFPNYIWGWGIEDRALYFRCCMRNISITDNPIKSFTTMPHQSNAIPYKGEKKKISDIWSKNNIDTLNNEQKEELISNSGLNNINYKILVKKSLHPIVDCIKVSI